MDSSRQPVKLEETAAPTNDILLLPHTPIPHPWIRTNITLRKPLRFYVPDNDDSVPYAFILGRHTVATAEGCEGPLLSGYFSALCAVLPDLTSMAREIMRNLGFQVEEVAVPSQADPTGIAIPQSQNSNLDIIMAAQMLFLPFQKSFDGDHIHVMWQEVARAVGVGHLSPLMVCSLGDMKIISTALGKSQLKRSLQFSISSSLQKLVPTSSSFGLIISMAKRRATIEKSFFGNNYTLYEIL